MFMPSSSSVSWKSGDGVSDQFPAGLRVLVVDDDPTCLKILEKMLRNCLYEGKYTIFFCSVVVLNTEFCLGQANSG